VLWRLHAIHHSQEQMNLFTDLRYYPGEYLVTVTLVALPMFIFANTLPVTFAYSLVHQSYTKLYHANIRTELGPLRHVLVTPQSHRIHHSILTEHRDRNFGVLLTVWDRLFGTAYLGGGYPRTGIADPSFPGDGARGVVRTLVAQSLYPLRGSASPLASLAPVGLFGEARGLLRFARGLPGFLVSPLAPGDAEPLIRRGMERRVDAFLEKVRDAVFANSRSPYLPLLRAAGCELADLAAMVGRLGVETTLERLRDAGVYVTYDEFEELTLEGREEALTHRVIVGVAD
jgi:hypothetical protein